MSGKCHRRNRHRGHRGSGLPSFFEGRSSLLDRSHRGSPAANPPGVPSLDEEVHFDDKIFREIKDYVMEAEREERVQAGNPSLYMLAPDVRWSEGASSSEGTAFLTSGAPPTDPNSRYIWEDWVFGLSNKMLGFISSEFRLGNSAC